MLARKVESLTRTSIWIDATNQSVKAVLSELQSATGWKIDGIPRLKDERVTFRFDDIPIRSLLELASMVADAELVIERDGEAVLRSNGSGRRKTAAATRSRVTHQKLTSAGTGADSYGSPATFRCDA